MVQSAESDNPSGTLQRGLAILGQLSHGAQPTAGDLIERLGISRSATFRVLTTLREHGLVEWDSTVSGRVVPGEQAVCLGVAGLRAFDPWDFGRRQLKDLAEDLGESALMALRDGGEMVYIAHEDHSDHLVGVRHLLGARRPVHASSLGKAYLAALPVAEREQIVAGLELTRFTDTTLTTTEALLADLAASQQRGWAIDDEEHEEGVRCFGVAVLDHLCRPVCSISVAGPKERIQADEAHITDRLIATARAMSRRLGNLDTGAGPEAGESSDAPQSSKTSRSTDDPQPTQKSTVASGR